MEGSYSYCQHLTCRGAVQVGLLSILFGVYIVLLVWMTGKCKIDAYSEFPKAQTSHPVLFSLFPGPSPNTTQLLHLPTPLTPQFPQTDKNTIMLVHEFNTAPNTLHRLSFNGCSYLCALTNDSSAADLLYLNAGKMAPTTTVLPVDRKKTQVWLLGSREPPTFPRFKYLNRTGLRGQVNWTRAIYNDATFPLNYGVLNKAKQTVERNFDAIYESKKHHVAWFVGHCITQSRREEYVRRMQSRISVHIYGECGNMTCGSGGYNMGGYKDVCLQMLSKNYKFYLAFENSFCENYVTEKFFNLFRGNGTVDVVPVVRGGADYKQLFDPAIFIDAADFHSPEDLADYLSILASDKEHYVSMLKQKNKYTFGRSPQKFECSLCRSLHLRDIPAQSYEDIYNFWTHPGRCWDPRDLEKG